MICNSLSINLGTRGRPQLLLNTLRRTLSNIHHPNTKLMVSVDNDDEKTIEAISTFAGSSVSWSVGPREDSLGEKYNRVLTEAPADAYLAMVDYAPHITPGFDVKILQAASLFPDGIGVVYNHMANASFPQINVVTHRMAEMMGGMYPPYFPYWFVDHWLDDLAKMTDRLAFVDVLIDCSARPGTQDMREPAFWATFFDVLWPMRAENARKIIAAMDEPEWRKTMLIGRFPLVQFHSMWINSNVRGASWANAGVDSIDDRYRRIRDRALKVMAPYAAELQKDQASGTSDVSFGEQLEATSA